MGALACSSQACKLNREIVLIDFDDRLDGCSFTVPASPNVRGGDARDCEPVGARADAVGDEKARIHSVDG